MANISEILESTEKIIFSEKKQPVSFREFVCGKDYCDDSDIYEFWLEEEVKIPQKCSELIIDGSLGGGKSTFSSYYTAYRVYKWFLNGDPRKELGIAANSDLYGFYFSVSLKMAEKSGFKLLYNVFKNCKWFKENMPMNTDLKSSIQFPNQRFQIDYASSECISEDSVVFTKRGIIKAPELRKGDLVWSGSDWKVVNSVSEFEDVEFYKITTERGTVFKSTFNHRHYTDRGFVRSDCIKVGDMLFYNKETLENDCPYQIISLEEFSNDRNKPFVDSIVLDEELAEVLGWLTGDGSFTDSKNSIRLFSNLDEVKTLEKYRKVLSKYWNIQEIKDGNNAGTAVQFGLQSKSAYAFFERLGLRSRAPQKRVPLEIFESPVPVMRAYLRGLFSSDGSMKSGHKNDGVIKRYACRITSSSEFLIRDVSYLIRYLGMDCSISIGREETSTGNKRIPLCMLTVCSAHLDKFNELIGFSIESKEALIKEFISRPREDRMCFRDKVKSIERIDNQKCYGADVEDHIYSVNGLITHNTHQTGLNVIIFILDEANFRGGVGTGVAQEYEEVTFLYSQLLDRLVTRFGRPDGTVDALAILVSSASYQSAFAEQRRSAVENDPNAYHIRAVGYKIKPQNYSKEMFTVFSGTATMEPLIVNSLEHKNKIIAALNMEGTGLAEKFFLDVPVSIKRFFETNINLALQNHCGVPTQIKGRFLQDINILKSNYTNDEDEIFSQRIISLSNADDIQLADYLIPENIQYPERPHSLFLDLSITGDSGGFSCVRFDGEKDGIRYHTHVFTLEIVPPPPPHQTRISKYRQFMSEFAQLVNVVAFGTDQFQSTGLRQDVKEDLDLSDVRLSIDSSDLPHLQWVRALVEKAMRMRRIEKLELEVIEAEHDLKKRRVVKKKGSTDDLFQSVVGAHWLSDTIGAQSGSIDDLTEGINLVGAQSYRRVLKKLGYNVSKR